MSITAIVPAAGMGKRFKDTLPKQFVSIEGKPILSYTIQKIHDCKEIDEIYLVVSEDKIAFCREELVEKNNFPKIHKIIAGGKERQDSVYNGIKELGSEVGLVVIHDGVRPFVDSGIFCDVINEAKGCGAAIAAIPEIDTIKQVSSEGMVEKTLKRDSLWRVQTPQVFRYDILKKAYEKAFMENHYATDDSALVEWAGYQVKVVKGSPYNIKITSPEDLELGKRMLGI
jgi:2-C-methyl-D-erythritol 4-phosphate cytidylyltransferase